MIDSDLSLTAGLIVLGFALIGVISAYSEGRPPRAAAFALLAGGGLVLLALTTHPGGYTFDDIPRAFIRVLARVLNG